MKIEIQSRAIDLDDETRRFVRRRVDFAMGICARHIDRVLVHVSDMSIPDDAGDRSCLVRVSLHGLPGVLVESQDSNLQVAVHRAVDRAGWTVARAIMRQRRRVVANLLCESLQGDLLQGDLLQGDLRIPQRAA